MTNSISMYNRFIEDSGNRSVLPELIEADLKEIKTVTVDREHLADFIKNNQDTWFMYTDEVRIGPNISYEPQRYLLECEFVSGESTVRIKLLHDQTYLVSFYESDPHSEPSGLMCYFDKELMARRDLQKYVKKLKYRIWYRLEDQGRWVPFLQQFTGFSK